MTKSSTLIGRSLYFLFVLACLVPLFVFLGYVAPGPLEDKKTIIIAHGTSSHEIANLLEENGVLRHPLIFRAAAKLMSTNSLKAGEYEFIPQQSIADILLMLKEGRSVVHLFTVAEGLTSEEVASLLKNAQGMSGDISMPPEGSLLPETYRYSYGDSRGAMIARMQKAMQEALNDLWAKRDQSILAASPAEAVVLASIVEKETGKVAERPRIAGVFYNRLRIHMRLQSDPTVIYAITRAKGPMDHDLDHDDLAFPSPYNTYASDGLPPKPICNPGRAAIEAVLHPEQNDYLYFVADGTGGHVFSHDLAEHNKNINKWHAVTGHN